LAQQLHIKQQILQGNRDMNTPIDPQAQETPPQINEQRRRLAKVGLAAPVVMGTLLSRPVLGAPPHHCTISGQMSGHGSPRFGDDIECNTLGDTPTTWAGTSTWPEPFVAGKPPVGSCPVETTTGTLFKNAASLGSVFVGDAFRCVPITEAQTTTTTTCSEYHTSGANAGKCKPGRSTTTTTTATVVIGSEIVGPSDTRFDTGVSATLQQVLETTSNVLLFSLGRAAVASLLNATKLAPNYPLTGKQVIDMFNAVYLGGRYDPLGIDWDATKVKTYFESLYS
jgi:hypothetical protein